MQLHCAKEHYHMAARLLGDFVQLDELRDTGIISDARADEVGPFPSLRINTFTLLNMF